MNVPAGCARATPSRRPLARLACVALLSACAGAPSAPARTAPASRAAPAEARYTNPVIDADFADPTAVAFGDGWYYAYATQTITATRRANIQLARSRDLVAWEQLPDVLPVKPSWAHTTQNFWAPHVLAAAGRYYLYFAAEPDSRDGMCLAVATATSPLGPFTDRGSPLACARGFVDIDAMAFDDPQTGRRLLVWGSNSAPIVAQELAEDRLHFAPGSQPIELVRARADEPYARLIEGPWIVRRGGYYYLFYSGDNCCGPEAHYAVMVARSRSATGPYETLAAATGRPHSAILERNARFLAPGHNSVITDAAGQDWLVYHAIDTQHREVVGTHYDRRPMLIDRLVYEDGWPRVAGGTPSTAPQPAPRRAL